MLTLPSIAVVFARALPAPQADGLTSILSWLGLAACVMLLATALAVWVSAVHLKAIEKRLAELDRLSEIKASIQPLVDNRGELDLRRLEHVLLDIRDGQRRVEERLLSVLESSQVRAIHSEALEPTSPSTSSLADRVVTRLLALGYERVQLVTTAEDLSKLSETDGEILVEARRDGAPCKGRVSVRGGRLTDVHIQAAYSAFP